MRFLSLDLGSSSCKALIVGIDGTCLGRGEAPYPTQYDADGAAEQNPDDWVDAAFKAGRLAVDSAAVPSVDAVVVVGVTHAAVLLDRKLRPVRPAITMFDTRSAPEVLRIERLFGAEIRRRTANDASSLWTWPQLAWLNGSEPDALRDAAVVVFPKDYVRLQLHRTLCTDVIDAAGSLLYDPLSNTWVDEFLADARLRPQALPEVRRPDEILGELDRDAARRLGLTAGAKVVVGTTDTAAEVLGTGAVNPGDTVLKLASVGRVARIEKEPIQSRGVINYPHVLPDLWYPGTASKHAASAFAWWNRILWAEAERPADAFERMAHDAGTADPGSSGALFLPHLSGEWAPLWDDTLRGEFRGLSMQHDRSTLTRAVLEGVAYAIRRAHDSLPPSRSESPSRSASQSYLIGQGARGETWGRIMASVFDRTLQLPSVLDAAFGGFVLGCLATHAITPEPDAIKSLNPPERTYAPDPQWRAVYAGHYARYTEIDDGLRA